MRNEDLLHTIHDILRSMGFRADCTGFFFLSYGAYLYLSQPMPLPFLSGTLYPSIADFYNTDMDTVHERIDAAIARAWRTHRTDMIEVMGSVQTRTPQRLPSEFEIIDCIFKKMFGPPEH